MLKGRCRRDTPGGRLRQGKPGTGETAPRHPYAHIARVAFDDITALTAEGFGYAAICEAFEANELLPEGSKPYSLSRGVRRKRARRQRRVGSAGTEAVQDAGGTQDADKK